jgi:hypothetical protein
VALNQGKPIADGGGHEVDDADDGAVLLLEGDIEVVSPPSLLFLSRVKAKNFGLDGGGALVSFPRWRRRLEIADMGGRARRWLVGGVCACSWQLGLVCCGVGCGWW